MDNAEMRVQPNTQSRTRDHSFDTLKGVLIFLVLLGHIISRLGWMSQSTSILDPIYFLIYSFHMPAMVMISGFFSKHALDSSARIRSLLKSLLIPLFVFNILYWAIFSRSFFDLMYIQWPLWYLLSLFIWRLIIYPASKFRFLLPISILFSLYIGFTEASDFLSISRTFAFFPFFVIGYSINWDTVRKFRKPNKVIPALVLAAAFSVALVMYFMDCPSSVLRMEAPYDTYGLPLQYCVISRLLVLLLGSVISLCLIAIATGKVNIFTHIGENTMVVYLLHSFTIKVIRFGAHHLDLPAVHQGCFLALAVVVSFLLCLLFSSKPFVKAYSSLMEKISSILLKPEPEPQSPSIQIEGSKSQ